MRKIGSVTEDTKRKIINSSKEEFYTKGYAEASIREIASKANVTTGAIYCFYEGKDGLFNEIIKSVIKPLLFHIRGHYEREEINLEYPSEKTKDLYIDLMEYILKSYYSNRKIWQIMINDINEPSLQYYLTEFIKDSTNHYIKFIKLINNNLSVPDYEVHQFVHMMLNSVINLLAHDYPYEEMKVNFLCVIKMLKAAFASLLK